MPAWMDIYIFWILKTGEKTRDPLYLGYTFKGAGALIREDIRSCMSGPGIIVMRELREYLL